MKAEILENMKRKGTAAPNLTESDIDLNVNYPSDIESRYVSIVPAEISCFHDYGHELALSLLYCLEIERNHRQKGQKQRNIN